MNLLILSGSAFPGSHTHAVARKIASLVEQPEHTVTHIDLRELHIPVFGQGKTDDVEALKRLAEKADAIIIGTPNYHTSFSGLLKNALDHLSMDEFDMKPVGLYCNSGGMRNSDPLTQLRMVMRGVHALVLPLQVCTCDADFERSDEGHQLGNGELIERLSVMIDGLVRQSHTETVNI
ncbi:NADPH-dependent FMN reductase [Salinicoccus hispanicus]|uniref:FMN-dependent NADPH-azoreductase n=1 Tax=Salinicoccus hispanicus TaxID=157225 RepID=A0A6N8U5Z3_9STAP|nr:NADPH-dependent FMN reductase [Salinicoccus hispanicus]MXQ51731.1 FMN-dependent NADH-azoreductase [Salinicoccus hispanicus]